MDAEESNQRRSTWEWAHLIVFLLIAVPIAALIVFGIGDSIAHYVTTPPHPCYDQVTGNVASCH